MRNYREFLDKCSSKFKWEISLFLLLYFFRNLSIFSQLNIEIQCIKREKFIISTSLKRPKTTNFFSELYNTASNSIFDFTLAFKRHPNNDLPVQLVFTQSLNIDSPKAQIIRKLCSHLVASGTNVSHWLQLVPNTTALLGLGIDVFPWISLLRWAEVNLIDFDIFVDSLKWANELQSPALFARTRALLSKAEAEVSADKREDNMKTWSLILFSISLDSFNPIRLAVQSRRAIERVMGKLLSLLGNVWSRSLFRSESPLASLSLCLFEGKTWLISCNRCTYLISVRLNMSTHHSAWSGSFISSLDRMKTSQSGHWGQLSWAGSAAYLVEGAHNNKNCVESIWGIAAQYAFNWIKFQFLLPVPAKQRVDVVDVVLFFPSLLL